MKKEMTFVLFGATGDLAVKKIFPALEALFLDGTLGKTPQIVATGRRDWSDAEFKAFLKQSSSVKSPKFLKSLSYSIIDVDADTGYTELASKLALGKAGAREVVFYTSLAPALHVKAITGLKEAGLLGRGKGKVMLEKPFGTDQKSACKLDKFLSSFLDEEQIYRVDHYLGKETVRAMMDLHENAPGLAALVSSESVERVRVRMFEEKGIDGRGASYDGVGAFRDVGQNHMLEMLAVIAADPIQDWQTARASALKRLAPPVKTCALSRRAQYAGYQQEKGVKAGSKTETSFEVVANFSSGKLKGVPIILEAGKMMGVSESFIELSMRDIPGLPQRIIFRVQPESDIVIEERDGSAESFEIPKDRDAYATVIAAALAGDRRSFVGRAEIEALWGYADHVVACWDKVPLEKYDGGNGKQRPFLIQ